MPGTGTHTACIRRRSRRPGCSRLRTRSRARGWLRNINFEIELNGVPLGEVQRRLTQRNSLPPMGNTLVSNVPGPKEHLYVKGARVLEMHPISTLPPSNLLNITLFSYAGDLHFGLIATDELPNLQRLGDYVQLAFTELEASVRDAHAAT